MKTKKNRWFIAIIVVIILGGTFYVYNQKKENEVKIAKQLEVINNEQLSFEKEKNESKQFKDLERLIKEADAYKAGTEKDEKVINQYSESISQSRTILKDKNEKDTKVNTIKSLDITPVKEIKEKVNALNIVLKRVNIQNLVVYNKVDLKNVKSKIDTLVQKYDKQVEKLKQDEIIQVEENQLISKKTKENKEASDTKDTEQVKETQSMNFSQIKEGNYTSLMGKWTEVAVSLNRHDTKGNVWVPATGEKLAITEKQLVDGSTKLAGKLLTVGSEDSKEERVVTFKEDEGLLRVASLEGAIAWNIDFYPKGVAMVDPDKPTTIDDSKDRITIRSSGNSYYQVFQKN